MFMCREAARRFAGGPQRARRRRKLHFDPDQTSPRCQSTDFEGGVKTMPMRRCGRWSHFRQSNVNMADEEPKVKSWPWQKKKVEVAGKPPPAPAQKSAAAGAGGGAAKGKPAGPAPSSQAAKSAGPGATAQLSQAKKPEDINKPAKPAKEASTRSEAEVQAKTQAEQKGGQDVKFSPDAAVSEMPGDAAYPVVSHYQMSMPGQFSYPYQLPISSQPIMLPDRAEADFCYHCGRGGDHKTNRKTKKKEKTLDMDNFLADVERKLTGKLQMQEMFMRELEEHYRDTLATRSPPPCRRSHTDNEESETEKQSCQSDSHTHLHHQLEGHISHRHSHDHHREDHQHRHQHKSRTHSRELEGLGQKCLIDDQNCHRHHPNQHPRPCPKATRFHRRHGSSHQSQNRNERSIDKVTPFSEYASSLRIRSKKGSPSETHKKIGSSSDEMPSSSCTSHRHTLSNEDSDSRCSSQRRSSHHRKYHGSHSNKSGLTHSSEEKGSKFRSQLEIITSQLPHQERNALRKSLASLRARREDKDLDRQLELLERELFAGSENVEWEQQLCLDSPTDRIRSKRKEVDAKEDRLLYTLYNEQEGFTDDDLMSEPEPV